MNDSSSPIALAEGPRRSRRPRSMEALMSDQAIPDFAQRVERAVAEADRLAAEMVSQGGSSADVACASEYQELVRLKVILEIETSRTLSETARIASALEEMELTKNLSTKEVD